MLDDLLNEKEFTEEYKKVVYAGKSNQAILAKSIVPPEIKDVEKPIMSESNEYPLP